jgi:hypothetical protein
MQKAGYVHAKAHRVYEAHGLDPLWALLHQPAGNECAVAMTHNHTALEVVGVKDGNHGFSQFVNAWDMGTAGVNAATSTSWHNLVAFS